MAAKSKTYEIAFALNGKTNSSLNKTFNGANKMMGALAKTAASLGATLAGGAIIKDAVLTYADFEQAMANVSAITGETGDNLKQLETTAREMGKKTTKTAKEAADALNYMGLAGWDMTQMMTGIEPILRLSEAGGLDLAKTSDLVTDSMSALGLEVSELLGFLDQVAKTAASSNTNIDALMEAFLVVGGSFREMNTPLDEANALLGILANRGKKGSEAGNSLSSILVNLTSGAGQAGDAMAALGVHAFDKKGNFKGITNTLLELNEAVSKLTEEDRVVALSEIGGKTQLDTLQALLAGVTAEYGDLRTKVADSDGALLRMAETMNDTTQGAWALFLSAMDEVKIKYASMVGPTLKELLHYAAEKIPKGIDQFVEACGGMMDKAIEVYGVIRDNWGMIAPIIAGVTVAMTLNKVATLALAAAQQKGTIINMLCTGWNLASKAITLLHSGTSIMTVAQMGLNAAMTANPVGVVVVAIGALIAIGVALWQNWDTVKAKAFELWEGIKSAFGGIGEWFSGIWEGIKTTFKTFVNFIIGGLNKIPEALNNLSFTIPSWVPGIGGQGMGLSLPMIPQFYTGTTGYNTPDTFIAGERGPELVTNAPGYKVFNAGKTKGMFGRSQGHNASNDAQFHFNPVINIYGGTGQEVEAYVQKAILQAFKLWQKEVKGMLKGKDRLAYNG